MNATAASVGSALTTASANSATSSIIHIAPWQLAFASIFVVAVIIIIASLRLGVARQFAFAALRTYVQVLALGYVLAWIFHLDKPLVIFAILLIMIGTASMTVAKRADMIPRPVAPAVFVVLFMVCTVVAVLVTTVIVGVKPWYTPQYLVPIAGMILGNSMSGMAIALERLYRDMDARTDEIRGLVALGATPREAADASIRAALKAGIIPGMNTLATAGIVFIPGMMSGQILAGVSPSVAAPYQIVILFMVGAADVIGSTLATLFIYRRHFDAQGAFKELPAASK